MSKNKTVVLTDSQIEKKIIRIAHQIMENFHEEEELVIVGIANKGYQFAERIYNALMEISNGNITLTKLEISKDDPLSEEIAFGMEITDLEGRPVLLVDDVLNSGRTLIYAATLLLKANLKRLSTAVLVDRRHRKYPIRADFVGLTLSTTIEETIKVDFAKGKEAAYLV